MTRVWKPVLWNIRRGVYSVTVRTEALAHLISAIALLCVRREETQRILETVHGRWRLIRTYTILSVS